MEKSHDVASQVGHVPFRFWTCFSFTQKMLRYSKFSCNIHLLHMKRLGCWQAADIHRQMLVKRAWDENCQTNRWMNKWHTARYQHLFFTFTFESPPTVNPFSQNGTCHLYSFLFMTSSTVTGYTGIRTARPSNCPARYDTPRSRNDEENVAVELDVPSIGKTPRGFVWKFWRNKPASNCYSLAVQVLSLYILKCG